MRIELRRGLRKHDATLDVDTSRPDVKLHSDDNITVLIYGHAWSPQRVDWVSPEEIASEYARQGSVNIADIDGVFVIALLDWQRNCAMVYTDPARLYYLYYRESAECLVFAERLDEIVESDSALDETAVWEFLQLGYLLGDHSLLKGVHRLPPACFLSIDRDLHAHWEDTFRFAGTQKEATAADIYDLLAQNISKGLQLAPKPLLPITAGLDSRVVLSAAMHAGRNLTGYTHGSERSRDMTTARKIARMLGVRHLTFSPERTSEFWSNLPETVTSFSYASSSCIDATLFFHLHHSMEAMKTEGYTLFSGVGGELYRYFYIRNSMQPPASRKELLELIWSKSALRLPGHLLPNDAVAAARAEMEAWIARQNDTDDLLHLSDRFYFYQRLAGFTSGSVRLIGSRGSLFLPFYSRELLGSLVAYPTHEKQKDTLLGQFVARQNPRLARVLVNDYQMVHAIGKRNELAAKCLRYSYYAKRVVNAALHFQLFPAGYVSLGYAQQLRREYRQFCAQNLFDHPALAGLVGQDGLQELAQGFFSRNEDRYLPVVSRAVSLNLLCRLLWPDA